MSRNWCFTINNYNNEAEPRVAAENDVLHGVAWVVWQAERGEAAATPHLQGYVQFSKLKRLSGVKKYLPTAHWEIRKGTHEQAKAYCMKTDTRAGGPWTWGEERAPEPGKRNDLLSLKEAVDAGRTELSIAEDDDLFGPWANHFRAVERYKRLKTVQQRNWMTESIIYWGPPGTGKTRRAQHEAGASAYWLPKPGAGQTPFFDGYDGQEVVVIDEYYGWLPFDLLCRMCDRYPLLVNTKGGMVNFYPKKIIFTSNVAPGLWYKNMGLGALKRRFTEPNGRIIHMDGIIVNGRIIPWSPPRVVEPEPLPAAAAPASSELAAPSAARGEVHSPIPVRALPPYPKLDLETDSEEFELEDKPNYFS